MKLFDKLMALAERLEGDDKATVYAAAFQIAPVEPPPTMETLTQPVPGLLHYMRYYRG
jgi:hypothetical protein